MSTFKPGDRVRFRDKTGTIEKVESQNVTVLWDNGYRFVHDSNILEPADAKPPAVEEKPASDKRSKGLYEKFIVNRTDGTDGPGMKHDGCQYFVLDLDHDPHAIPAIKEYMKSCGVEYPRLAEDLRILLMSKVLERKP